jgi:hypothetical protein
LGIAYNYLLSEKLLISVSISAEKNWFEREQQAAEAARTEEAAAVAARRETSSVPVVSGAPPEHLRCFLCHDLFDQFYNDDIDEWHLRNAVEHEGNNYHPVCLDDHKVICIEGACLNST